MPSPVVSPARLTAFKILERVETEQAYASVLLAAREDQLTAKDRALCHELTMGVLRQQLFLDRLIGHYSNRSPERMDLSVLIALRLGLYQIRFLTRTPHSAAVSESVSLVKLSRVRSAAGLVNATLRRAIREPDYDPCGETKDPIERLAVETSHPHWLLQRWVKALGFPETRELAIANNKIPPIGFRIVETRVGESELLEKVRATGAELVRSAIAHTGWRIKGATTLVRELAREGQIHIQDEASQLVAEIAKPGPGDLVLDVCSAPGGKTTQMAAMAHDEALIVAGDLYQHRLRTVVALAARHHLKSVRAVALNGLSHLPFTEQAFDCVLLDAPCSGTGTLRRNPEIRWRIIPADIADLAERQRDLIWNAAQMVRTGGRLVYSTCSLEPEENEEVVALFLQRDPSFRCVPAEVSSGLSLPSGAVRTWPHRHDSDGFFVAMLQRQ